MSSFPKKFKWVVFGVLMVNILLIGINMTVFILHEEDDGDLNNDIYTTINDDYNVDAISTSAYRTQIMDDFTSKIDFLLIQENHTNFQLELVSNETQFGFLVSRGFYYHVNNTYHSFENESKLLLDIDQRIRFNVSIVMDPLAENITIETNYLRNSYYQTVLNMEYWIIHSMYIIDPDLKILSSQTFIIDVNYDCHFTNHLQPLEFSNINPLIGRLRGVSEPIINPYSSNQIKITIQLEISVQSKFYFDPKVKMDE